MTNSREAKTILAEATALREIAEACEARAHPGGPLLISERHLQDMLAIAAKARAALTAVLPKQSGEWQTIESEPSDGSEIWISNGETVWLGTAHKDGSLKLPNRSECKFWMPANKPAAPSPQEA